MGFLEAKNQSGGGEGPEGGEKTKGLRNGATRELCMILG